MTRKDGYVSFFGRRWYRCQERSSTNWRSKGLEINHCSRNWWQLQIGISHILDDYASFVLKLLGWSLYVKTPWALGRHAGDDDKGFEISLNEFGLRIELGCWFSRTFDYPWQRERRMTEILDPQRNVVYTERDEGYYRFKLRKLFRIDRKNTWSERFEERTKVAETVSVKLPYAYKLKSGAVQNVTATCFIERATYAWWSLPFIRKAHTYLEVAFSDEVGEGSGGWKGGCTACAYEMRPEETIEMTLRRMERDREFRR